MKKIVLLNASLGGALGNTSRLFRSFSGDFVVDEVLLSQPYDLEALKIKCTHASGFIFVTGTYWDSWSSHLQQFLENSTAWEATDIWLGKPAGVLVSMHSVGGKAVLSRLQGVLVTLGCNLPPFSGVVLSKAVYLAQQAGVSDSDFWSGEDVTTLLHNVVLAAQQPKLGWKVWPVDSGDPRRIWISD